MKYLKLTVLALGLLLVYSCSNGQSGSQQTNLDAKSFSEKLTAGAQLIDVRTPEEFANGHLKNAKNIDWNGEVFDAEISKLDKSKPVFVYCLSGGRSEAAARQMRNEGFKQVYELDGGMMKWRAAGLPETTEGESRPQGMNKKQFDNLLNSDKLVLIDFYAEWCAPCKKMKPYLDEISKEMETRVTIVRLDADINRELCNEMKIEGLPVLLLYKGKGLIWSNNGYMDKQGILDVLKQNS